VNPVSETHPFTDNAIILEGEYASLQLRTNIDGNRVDTVANLDSSDRLCKGVR